MALWTPCLFQHVNIFLRHDSFMNFDFCKLKFCFVSFNNIWFMFLETVYIKSQHLPKETILAYFFLIIYIKIFLWRTCKLKNDHTLKLTRPRVYTSQWASIHYSNHSEAVELHTWFCISTIKKNFMQLSTAENQFLNAFYFSFSYLLWLSELCSVEVVRLGTLVLFLAWEDLLLVSYYLV